jgi:prepilin-type N-terminal cleavage/methylation domain-containing protein
VRGLPLKRATQSADAPPRLTIGGIRDPISEQRGWTLVEMLIVILILGLILGAVITLSASGQKAAARDNERNVTVALGNTFVARITNELRQATKIHLSDTSCPTSTSAPANCIDFDLANRTLVTRDASGNFVSATRSSRRVRINCSTGTCFRAVSTNVATAPSSTAQQQFATKLQNASASATPPIFDYKAWGVSTPPPAGWRSVTLSFSSPSIVVSPPNWINVTLVMGRAGERRTRNGLQGNVDIQDAADLKNMNIDSSPCSPAAVAQAGC